MKIDNSKLKPWILAGGPACLEPTKGSLELPTGTFVEASSVLELPVTSQIIRPVTAPLGMTTEPMTFPNMVTGYERNPKHAARAALSSRFGTEEWANNSAAKFAEANTNSGNVERLRNNSIRIMYETDEKATIGQLSTGRRLGERLTDVDFWKNELNNENQKLVAEATLLASYKNKLTKAIQELEIPFHIAQECLYFREAREGVNKANDQPEINLLKEVFTYRATQKKLGKIFETIMNQLHAISTTQYLLEDDVDHKEATIRIDKVCQQLNNFSSGLKFYDGIEKLDPTISTQESWYQFSNDRVKKSIAEREKSANIRNDIDILINESVNRMYDAWNITNTAFEERIDDLTDAKNKYTHQLKQVQREISGLEKSIYLLRKSIRDKDRPLKVAQTRLEKRSHREDIELCKDSAQLHMIKDVRDIQESVSRLQKELEQAETQYKLLVNSRNSLEADLKICNNALFIDKEKCMGIRLSIPVENLIRL